MRPDDFGSIKKSHFVKNIAFNPAGWADTVKRFAGSLGEVFVGLAGDEPPGAGKLLCENQETGQTANRFSRTHATISQSLSGSREHEFFLLGIGKFKAGDFIAEFLETFESRSSRPTHYTMP